MTGLLSCAPDAAKLPLLLNQCLESLFTDLDTLIETRAEFLRAPVDFPEDGLSSSKTLEAVTRAVETGKPFGFVSIGGRDAKEQLPQYELRAELFYHR